MNDLIERYIYDVTKRLDEKKRKDIEDELRANIYDMLGDDLSEEHIVEVLKQLGRPSDLALEYKDKKSYLISPRQFDDYIKVLKIVFIVFIAVTIFGSVVGSILDTTGINILGSIIKSVTEDLSNSLFFGFTIVTIIFWAIDQNTEKKAEFDPRKLAKVPEDKHAKSRRVEGIVGAIMILFFGSIFIGFIITNRIDVYINVEDNMFIYDGHFFTSEYMKWIIPVFIISMINTLAQAIFKIVKTKTTITAFAFYTAIDFITLLAFTILTVSLNVFDQELLSTVATSSNKTLTEVISISDDVVVSILLICWISFTIEQIVEWIKLLKNRKTTK